MLRLSITKAAVVAGGLAVSLGLGTGVASADPLDAAVNTTCNYGQVMAALNAQDPGAAAQLTASPMAMGWLNSFLASAPPKRRSMAAQLQAMPGAAAYVGLVESVAVSCNNY